MKERLVVNEMKQPANTSSIIDYNSVIPLYEQVANALRADIQGGAFDATKRLPTEEELAEKYGISRITVRRAVGDLVEEGLVEKKQGKGTFIRTPKMHKDMNRSGMSFTELMNSDVLDRALTCGAVYGFLAGIVAFICCYMGERIPHLVLDQPDEDYE